MRIVGLLLVAAVAHAGAPTPDAGADKRAAAMRLFDAGKRLFDEGRFADAAREFEHAYDEQPLPDFSYNAAAAYDKAGLRKESVAMYRKYLALDGRDKRDDPIVRARLEVLERELAMWGMPPTRKKMSYPYVESSTRQAFQTYLAVGGRDHALVGAGARSVLGFKVYAMGLYVDDEGARKAFPKLAAKAGGADLPTLTRDELAAQFVVQGEFAKHAVLRFLRAVTAAKQRDSYREALGAEIAGAKAPAAMKKDAEAFLALFDKEVKEGDELVIHTDPDGKIQVQMPGGPMRAGPANQRLEFAIWNIWLGAKPISADLKRGLLERVDTLGR